MSQLRVVLQLFLIFGQHSADQMRHTPGRFIGHAQFLLELGYRDVRVDRREQETGVKPLGQWGPRLVIDGARCEVDVVAATVAGVRLSRSHPVVLCDPPARLAKDPVREDLVLQPLKTRVVIRELLLKRLEIIKGKKRHRTSVVGRAFRPAKSRTRRHMWTQYASGYNSTCSSIQRRKSLTTVTHHGR